MTEEEELHFPNLSLDKFQRSIFDLITLIKDIPRQDCRTIFGSTSVKVEFVTQKASGHRSKLIEVCILKRYQYEEWKDSTKVVSLCEKLAVKTEHSQNKATKLRSQFLFLSPEERFLVEKRFGSLLRLNSVVNVILFYIREERIDWMVTELYKNSLSQFQCSIEVEISKYNQDLQEMIPSLLLKRCK